MIAAPHNERPRQPPPPRTRHGRARHPRFRSFGALRFVSFVALRSVSRDRVPGAPARRALGLVAGRDRRVTQGDSRLSVRRLRVFSCGSAIRSSRRDTRHDTARDTTRRATRYDARHGTTRDTTTRRSRRVQGARRHEDGRRAAAREAWPHRRAGARGHRGDARRAARLARRRRRRARGARSTDTHAHTHTHMCVFVLYIYATCTNVCSVATAAPTACREDASRNQAAGRGKGSIEEGGAAAGARERAWSFPRGTNADA